MATESMTIKVSGFGETRHMEALKFSEGGDLLVFGFAGKLGRGAKVHGVSLNFIEGDTDSAGFYHVKSRTVTILNRTGLLIGFWKPEYDAIASEHIGDRPSLVNKLPDPNAVVLDPAEAPTPEAAAPIPTRYNGDVAIFESEPTPAVPAPKLSARNCPALARIKRSRTRPFTAIASRPRTRKALTLLLCLLVTRYSILPRKKSMLTTSEPAISLSRLIISVRSARQNGKRTLIQTMPTFQPARTAVRILFLLAPSMPTPRPPPLRNARTANSRLIRA